MGWLGFGSTTAQPSPSGLDHPQQSMPKNGDDIPYGFVPISVRVHASNIMDSVVVMCPLRNELHVNDPASYPMFRFIVAASQCEGPRRIERSLQRVQEVLDEEANAIGPNGIESQSPKGFVFHLARCGSTLVANMLSAIGPQNVVYSESAPPPEVIKSSASKEDK